MGSPTVVPNQEKPTGNAAESAAQGRSTIRFPYLDQDDAVGVAKKIFDTSGNTCEKDTLAAALGVSADGGGFNLRLVTAKMFGFISGEKGSLQLTELGQRVIHTPTEKSARAESFLLVPLYKRIYDDYKGQSLPPNPALEAHMERLGVAPKQKDKARQVFQRSATQAGYFAFGNTRLVQPQLKASGGEVNVDPPVREPKLPDGGTSGGGGFSSGGGGGGKSHHPFIAGLLDTLPEAGADWDGEERRKWLQTAAGIFGLIYKAKGNSEMLVTIVKSEPEFGRLQK